MKIICISDTHKKHRQLDLPEGDILIHAGDITGQGEMRTMIDFNKWLGELPHPYKVVIGGNHDISLGDERREEYEGLLTNCIYLHDSEVTIEGIKFYGSPYQPTFGVGWQFNLPRGEQLAAKWALIPDDTDILITHGPPNGFGDRVKYPNPGGVYDVGCDALRWKVEQIKPKLHVSGHIHEDSGVDTHIWEDGGVTMFVNACSLDLGYNVRDQPCTVINLPIGGDDGLA